MVCRVWVVGMVWGNKYGIDKRLPESASFNEVKTMSWRSQGGVSAKLKRQFSEAISGAASANFSFIRKAAASFFSLYPQDFAFQNRSSGFTKATTQTLCGSASEKFI